MADRVVEEGADGIAEHAAEHRGDRADQRIEAGLLRSASTIGTSTTSGGTGKERALGEGHGAKREKRVAALAEGR